jgi:hypothetical protein
MNVREGGGLGVRRWFDDDLMKTLENGENILFSRDRWMEEEPFCAKFSENGSSPSTIIKLMY